MMPSVALKGPKKADITEAWLPVRDFWLLDLLGDGDPYKALQSGKVMARAWSGSLPDEERLALIRSFMYRVMQSFWNEVYSNTSRVTKLPILKDITLSALDESVTGLAWAIGSAAAQLEVITASYELGNIYTAVLPAAIRSGQGVFYTPPALTNRLLKITAAAGVDWSTARVLDPACGGGAFLTPVALKIAAALPCCTPAAVIQHIESHLTGYEIDPFGAWLTQVFVEVALKDILCKTDRVLAPLVKVCNSLEALPLEEDHKFDLVIGNPPYGKVKLSDQIRNRYHESLYGHANYYGLFTQLATELVKAGGVIGFLTPTSFLSGEYFKNLRRLLRKKASPHEIDFVTVRKGVFEDVLQETMLAVYQNKLGSADRISVNQITTLPGSGLAVISAGTFKLGEDLSAPWILPRNPGQGLPVRQMNKMKTRLSDWGYKVSTGPLVWNRHKDQLCKRQAEHTYPIIWSESITRDGRFVLKADKKNHLPYFKFKAGDECLLIQKPCILLQRTTAKEQDKRLIAAALPLAALAEYKGVVVENHLNMIIPLIECPKVSPAVLAAFLNSKIANEAFRAISGSVAVSAYELEAFPLPSVKKMEHLDRLLAKGAGRLEIEEACYQLFMNG